MRLPKKILSRRLSKFQEKLIEHNVDAVMLRTLSSFIYFTGIKWLRPALLIPAEGKPTAFIAKGEEEGFKEKTGIENIATYIDGGELMGKVSKTIRENKYKTIGLEFGLERDAYILFYEVFKKLNPKVEIIDVGPIITEMRLIKDEHELNCIRKAGEIAVKAMEKTISIIEEGVTETEIAAEAYGNLYREGCEEPHVYVNIGPHPRVHSEPLRDIIARKGVLTTITIGADYNRYYANITRTIHIGRPNEKTRKTLECMEETYRRAVELTKPGVKFIDVIKELDKIYRKYNLINQRLIGYTHGVGLQIEEKPITTILPRDRLMEVERGMALAFIHSPIMIKGLGQVKKEDTFIVKQNGELENVTKLEL